MKGRLSVIHIKRLTDGGMSARNERTLWTLIYGIREGPKGLIRRDAEEDGGSLVSGRDL